MIDDLDDIAAMRADGDLKDFLLSLTAAPAAHPKPKPATVEPTTPAFHIPRPGAWPCGTAPSGPTPPPCSHETTPAA